MQESLKEAQGMAHQRDETAPAIDEVSKCHGGDQEGCDKNDRPGPVLAFPVMPEDQHFKKENQALEELLEDGKNGESSAKRVE